MTEPPTDRPLRTVAVLSDVHGVLGALERVLAEPAVQDADLVVVTGDHVWGPLPTEVLERLTGEPDRVLLLRGNADREIPQMSRGEDVGLGDDPVSVWGAQQLTAAHQRLLDELPEHLVLPVAGFGRVHFCHATPRDDQEVVLVDSRVERWQEVLGGLPPEVETVVCGHTHMPYVRLVDRRTVVNPGSVGLPYGRPGAHWALLHDGAVSLRRTVLDADELIRATAVASTMPGVEAGLDGYLRHPPSDLEALATFGPRDGR